MIASFAIGNSDDKLSQSAWSAFVGEVHAAVDQAVLAGGSIHFAGYSAPGAPWQNALWAIEMPDGDPDVAAGLRSRLTELAGRYHQDSIAWWQTRCTEMLVPAPRVGR